jgi:hypothetical protein
MLDQLCNFASPSPYTGSHLVVHAVVGIPDTPLFAARLWADLNVLASPQRYGLEAMPFPTRCLAAAVPGGAGASSVSTVADAETRSTARMVAELQASGALTASIATFAGRAVSYPVCSETTWDGRGAWAFEPYVAGPQRTWIAFYNGCPEASVRVHVTMNRTGALAWVARTMHMPSMRLLTHSLGRHLQQGLRSVCSRSLACCSDV